MSVHDLLLALMLPSADDAAEDLAYNVGQRLGCALHRDDERASASARADADALLDADRPRHAGQLFDRPLTWSSSPATTSSTRVTSRRIVALPARGPAHGELPCGYVVNRNDLVGRVSVDQRRQDRPHHRCRLRARRVRAPGRDDPDQRGARHHQRGGARREHTRAAGLRVRELPTRAPGQAGADARARRRCASSPESTPRWSRRAG